MTHEWTTAAPETLGFEPRQLAAIDGAFRRGRLRNLHGVVVVRHGTLVFESYMAGRDERWGSPLGDVTFGPDTLHDVRSVTNGGQRLIVVPDLALVVVVTAGNYNAPDNWRLPIAILNQFVLPSLVAAER